jgi:hypothetical protein
MTCGCGDRDTPLARRVQLRGDVRPVPLAGFASPDDPAYRENTAFRPAFVCPACCAVLDRGDGTGAIGGRVYGLDGRSRGDAAAVYDEARYQAYQRTRAARLGIATA